MESLVILELGSSGILGSLFSQELLSALSVNAIDNELGRPETDQVVPESVIPVAESLLLSPSECVNYGLAMLCSGDCAKIPSGVHLRLGAHGQDS